MQPARLLLPWLAVVTGVIGSPQIDPSSEHQTSPIKRDTSWWWPSSAETTTSSSRPPGDAHAPESVGSFYNTAPKPKYDTTADWIHGFTAAPTPTSNAADDWSVPTTVKSVDPTWSPLKTTKTPRWPFFNTTPKPATIIAWTEKASTSPSVLNSPVGSAVPTNYDRPFKEVTYPGPPYGISNYSSNDNEILQPPTFRASNPSSDPSFKLPKAYNIPSSNDMLPFISSAYETSTKSPAGTGRLEGNNKIPPISTKNIPEDRPKDKLVEIKKEQHSTIPNHDETSTQEDDEEDTDQKISSESNESDDTVQSVKVIDTKVSPKIPAISKSKSEKNNLSLGVGRSPEIVTTRPKPSEKFPHDDKSSTESKSLEEIEGGDAEDDDPSHSKTLDQRGPKSVPTSSTEMPSNIMAGEGKVFTKGVGRSPWSSLPPVEPSSSTAIPDSNIIDTNPDDILSSYTAKPSSNNSPSQDRGVGRAISRSSVQHSNVPGIYEMSKTTSNFVPLETFGPPRSRSGSPHMPIEQVYVENAPFSEEIEGPYDNKISSVEDEVFDADERGSSPTSIEEHHHHHIPHIHKPHGHHGHTHVHNLHHQARSEKPIAHHTHTHHHVPKATAHHNTKHLHPLPTVIETEAQPVQNMYPVNNNNQYVTSTKSIPPYSILYNNMPIVPFVYNPPIYPNVITDADYGPQEFLFQLTETI